MQREYGEELALPTWFVVLVMAFDFGVPWVVATLIALNYIGPLGQPTTSEIPVMPQLWGAAIAIIAGALLAVVMLVYALFYYNEYWFKDVERTRFNAIAVLVILGFPIAFALTANTSVALYFTAPMLLAVILVAVLYDFKPRVSTGVAMGYSVFWGSLTTLLVDLLISGSIYNWDFARWIGASINMPSYVMSIISYTTLGIIKPALAQMNPQLQVYGVAVVFSAFVVGFTEEAYARLTIPLFAKALGDDVLVSVISLGIIWLGMHAVPIAAQTMNIYFTIINVFILSLISWFIFYTFAKTGNYVAVGIAHGLYDACVASGFFGFVLAIALLIGTAKYASLKKYGY